MSDNKFVTGLFVNPPHEKAPDFVKASISIKPAEFIAWLQAQEPNDKGYVRLQFKESREGKWYAALDDYKPADKKAEHNQAKADGYAKEPAQGGFVDDEIPFMPRDFRQVV